MRGTGTAAPEGVSQAWRLDLPLGSFALAA
jgi:hypothetical protein